MNPSLIIGLRSRDLSIIVVLRVIMLASVSVQLNHTKVTTLCLDLMDFDRNSESTLISTDYMCNSTNGDIGNLYARAVIPTRLLNGLGWKEHEVFELSC